MNERTGWDRGLSVRANGKGLVGHAGAVPPHRLADRAGLTTGLAGTLPSSTSGRWRDRAGALAGLAVAITLGARNLLEAEQLGLHHRPLLGPPASDSTLRRLLAGLDQQTMTGIARVRARVRRHVWALLHQRPGGFPWIRVAGRVLTGWLVLDLDATFIASASKKEGAAPTFRAHSGSIPSAGGWPTPERAWRCSCGKVTPARIPSPTTSVF